MFAWRRLLMAVRNKAAFWGIVWPQEKVKMISWHLHPTTQNAKIKMIQHHWQWVKSQHQRSLLWRRKKLRKRPFPQSMSKIKHIHGVEKQHKWALRWILHIMNKVNLTRWVISKVLEPGAVVSREEIFLCNRNNTARLNQWNLMITSHRLADNLNRTARHLVEDIVIRCCLEIQVNTLLSYTKRTVLMPLICLWKTK